MERAEEIAWALVQKRHNFIGDVTFANLIVDALCDAHASGKREGIAEGRHQVESGSLMSMSAAKALSDKEYERGAKEFRERAVAELRDRADRRRDEAKELREKGDKTTCGALRHESGFLYGIADDIESLPLTVETKEK